MQKGRGLEERLNKVGVPIMDSFGFKVILGYSIFKPYRGIDELFQGVVRLDFPRGVCSLFKFSKGVIRGFQEILQGVSSSANKHQSSVNVRLKKLFDRHKMISVGHNVRLKMLSSQKCLVTFKL